MTEDEYARKLAEIDRLLNDPDVPPDEEAVTRVRERCRDLFGRRVVLAGDPHLQRLCIL
jgi:hypothetical protein